MRLIFLCTGGDCSHEPGSHVSPERKAGESWAELSGGPEAETDRHHNTAKPGQTAQPDAEPAAQQWQKIASRELPGGCGYSAAANTPCKSSAEIVSQGKIIHQKKD